MKLIGKLAKAFKGLWDTWTQAANEVLDSWKEEIDGMVVRALERSKRKWKGRDPECTTISRHVVTEFRVRYFHRNYFILEYEDRHGWYPVWYASACLQEFLEGPRKAMEISRDREALIQKARMFKELPGSFETYLKEQNKLLKELETTYRMEQVEKRKNWETYHV